MTTKMRVWLYGWFVGSLVTAWPALAQQTQRTIAQEVADQQPAEDKPTPPLSAEALFHPDQRFDYFGPRPPKTRWLADSRLAIETEEQWEILNPATGEREAWDWPEVAATEMKKLAGFSESELKAATDRLVQSAEGLADPVMVRIDNGIAVVGGGDSPRLVTRDARGWQSPTLSPDGTAIAYVRENDLYVIRVDSGEILRLTQEGSDTVLCGRLDWTYQEEIYGRGNYKGFWWSPDSRHIAFLRIDISEVHPFTLTRSGTPRGEAIVTRYPKAGDPIPKASLHVVDSESLQITAIHRPSGEEAESLVVRVTWRPDGRRLTYQIQNRVQTWLELRESDYSAAEPRVLLREEGPAWIEVLGEPYWLPGGDFLWLSDLPAGRRHVWRVAEDGSRRIPITSGDWDVREIVRVLPEDRRLFVSGDRERGVRGQQLYSVRWTTAGEPAGEMNRITEAAGWHRCDVSEDGRWFVDTFSSLTREPVKSLMAIENGGFRELRRLGPSEEEAANAPWQQLELVEPQWLEVRTRDGVSLPAYIVPPPRSLRDHGERFPVLVYTYGGPQAPSAVDRWSGRNFLFHQLLASRGIGVFVVDNRSSGGRGIADTWTIHRRVGVQELADLLDAVQRLTELEWVDSQRLAIRGWSFGGFYTTYAMTHSDKFAAGIAGGSVTDWRNYDAFYTERYMDTPQANKEGYDETSVLLDAENLQGRLLLIHGEVDDNVHPGNTLQLVAALQEAGKSFELMIYPDAAHGVRDSDQVYHLYRLMVDFLVRQLKPGGPVQGG